MEDRIKTMRIKQLGVLEQNGSKPQAYELLSKELPVSISYQLFHSVFSVDQQLNGPVSVATIVKYRDVLEKNFTLDVLSRYQLAALCSVFSLGTFPFFSLK
jgi:hypothetical protein